jgi:hypothetical protein
MTMAGTRVVIDRATLTAAAHSPVVRMGLRQKRDRILARAERLAIAGGAPGFARALRRESGTRPGTKSPSGIRRPFERVIATSTDASKVEYGDKGVRKQAILRRAASA